MSKWRVSSTWIGNQKRYQVIRTIDEEEVDHSGNREVLGATFVEYKLAQYVADQMNGGKDASDR